jgi:2-methylisocitrate lyase-like PEP mutase family enzyme
MSDLQKQANQLRELHRCDLHSGEPLLLPNVWDAASARIVVEAGFPAVATASAAITAMLGYPDGEGAPWAEMFAAAGRIARAAVRPAAVDAGVPIVVNARVDVFLPASGISEADRVGEAVRRGQRYRAAGADCIYPIGVRRKADLATLVTELPGPINGNTGDELDLATLRELGVARVSYGPRFYRAAMADFDTAVRALLT